MAMQNPYDKLKQNAIFTTPKEELTLMLYDGALRFCNQAIIALENKDLMRVNELLIKVQNIIREFQLTLNRDYEVSDNFAAMYDYIYRQLIEANLTKNMDILCEARDLIRGLRDIWKEAMLVARSSQGKTK